LHKHKKQRKHPAETGCEEEVMVICPFMSTPTDKVACVESGCMLFAMKDGYCAINDIAVRSTEIEKQLKLQNEILSKLR
jgi:hypothetical protein